MTWHYMIANSVGIMHYDTLEKALKAIKLAMDNITENGAPDRKFSIVPYKVVKDEAKGQDGPLGEQS